MRASEVERAVRAATELASTGCLTPLVSDTSSVRGRASVTPELRSVQSARGKRGQPDQPSHKGQDAGHDSKEQRASDSSARPKPEDQAETERDKDSEPKRRGCRLAAACAKEQPSQDTSGRPNDQWKQLLHLGRKGHHHAKPEPLRRVRRSMFRPTVAVVRQAVKPMPRRACLRQPPPRLEPKGSRRFGLESITTRAATSRRRLPSPDSSASLFRRRRGTPGTPRRTRDSR